MISHRMNRFLSIVLIFIMLLSGFPAGALASEPLPSDPNPEVSVSGAVYAPASVVEAVYNPSPPTHGLADGFYTADVYAWHATSDKASAMVNLLSKRAYINVVGGKAEVTARFIVGYPRPNGLFDLPIEVPGSALAELFPEASLADIEAGQKWGTGIKGQENQEDRSKTFQFELSSLNYPTVVFNVDQIAPMKVEARLKFENITRLDNGPEDITEITVKKNPKLDYYVNQPLDLTGLELILKKADGTSREVAYNTADDFNIINGITMWLRNGTVLKEENNGTSVTVSYGNFDGEARVVKLPITVKKNQPVEITVKAQPKTAYAVGENLDLTGLAVTLIKPYGETEEVEFADFAATGLAVNPAHGAKLVPGTDKITITHTASGVSVEQPITVGLTDGLYKADVYGWHATNNAASMMSSSLAKRAYIEVKDGKAKLRVRFVPTSIFGMLIDGRAIAEVFEVSIGDDIWNDPYKAGLGTGIKGVDYPDKSRVFEIELKEPIKEQTYQPVVYNVVAVGMVTAGRFKIENITPISGTPAKVTKVEFVEGKSPKSTYVIDEKLDLSGTELKLSKDDGTTETLTYAQYSESGDFHLWPWNNLAMLTAYQNITIAYSNYDGTQAHAAWPVRVLPLAEAIKDANVASIELAQEPAKKIYNVGEAMTSAQLAGLSVKLGYDNGVSAAYSAAQLADAGISISPAMGTVFDEVGTKTITLSHANISQQAAFNLTVKNVLVVEKLTVKTKPARTLYVVGETINTTVLKGLVVTVGYDDGSEQDFALAQLANAGLTIEPPFNTELKENDIGGLQLTIKHESTGKTATFDAEVKAAKDVIQTIARAQFPASAYYNVGDKLNLANLQVTVTYRDGKKVEKIPYADFSQYGLVATINNVPVTAELEAKELTLTDAGTLYVTSPGTGINTQIDGVVVVRADVKEIRIKTPPAKTVFTVGDNIQTGLGTNAASGISFTIVYDDNTTKDATLTQLWPANLISWWEGTDYVLKAEHVGLDKITFKHLKSGTQVVLPIAVKDYKAADGVESISIGSQPAASFAGQKLNFTGMVVHIHYADGVVAAIPSNQWEAAGLEAEIPDGYKDILPESAVGTKVPVRIVHKLSGQAAQAEMEIKSGNTVKAVAISANPARTTFFEGEPLDLTGLKVTLELQNGVKTENLDYTQLAAYGLAPNHDQGKVFESIGTTTLYITHTESKIASASIYLNIVRSDLAEIRLKTLPKRTAYYVGEQINAALLDGLAVDLVWPDGKYTGLTSEMTIANLIKYQASYGVAVNPAVGTVLTKEDVGALHEITLQYEFGREEPLVLKIPVTVAEPVAAAIAVKQAPAKISYKADEPLDLTGLVVSLTKEDGTAVEVGFTDFAAEGIAVSPAHGTILTTADTRVTITHVASGKTAVQDITVVKKGSTNPADMEDGVYEVEVEAIRHGTNNVRSAMADALDPRATLEIKDGVITATIRFVKATLFKDSEQPQQVDGRAVAEIWTEPESKQPLDGQQGNGIKGKYNENDQSQEYTFVIPSLELPVLAMTVVPMDNSIQRIHLKFNWDADPTEPTDPTEPDLDNPVELAEGIVESSTPNEAKVDAGKLQVWLAGLAEEVKAAAAVEIKLADAANSVQNAVVIPVAVLEAQIKEAGIAGLQLVKQSVQNADGQGVTAALSAQTTSTTKTSLVDNFDLKLQQIFANGDVKDVHQLGGKIKIAVALTETQVTAIAKGTAKLFYYNPDTKELEVVQAVFNPTARTATFYTEHLSVYVIAVTETTTPGGGGGGGGNLPLNPDNLPDGTYTISARALKEALDEASMCDPLISGKLGLTVSSGVINVTLNMQGTETLPMKEVKTLWYRDANGSYIEASKEFIESGNSIVFRFPVESITKEQFMQVEVPMVTDSMPSLPIFRLVFNTSTLERGSIPAAPTTPQAPAATSFIIKAEAGEGGTITPSGEVKVEKGKDQEFKIKANEGYKIKHVIVDGKSVGAEETYTFEKVQKAATISVSFEKIKSAAEGTKQTEADLEAELAKIVFEDTAGHWAEKSIQLAVSKQLFEGVSDKQFAPDATMTRGMLVTVLGRLAKVKVDSYTTVPFADVDPDQYYAKYVAWAADNRIVSGFEDGSFAPDQAISREQLAVIFANYIKFAGIDLTLLYADAAAEQFADADSISPWAADSVRLARQAGIVQGREDNRFDPKGTATRAEVTAIIARALDFFASQAK
ncbi:S-layer homology domain-containing protein [Paenibacillus sp. YN15]|uniref:S-layer homology domain-containing protein n=1 Tax=Paenibacillus sp. YN15 TaxID=1742774 RepID=UPI000DCB3302|nr:NEAT domain-containing protein [Paenibacillus sp. YN15]RAU99864.1 hypothetical protein DQG13_15315 [Paenibacillus sp. YN15]